MHLCGLCGPFDVKWVNSKRGCDGSLSRRLARTAATGVLDPIAVEAQIFIWGHMKAFPEARATVFDSCVSNLGETLMETQSTYNYKVVRQFAVMTVVWGIVGMLVGVIIAAQLVWPDLNFGPWLHFGRLRPLHTNAVIFAFGGCHQLRQPY
jgi:uncharacterized protein YacL